MQTLDLRSWIYSNTPSLLGHCYRRLPGSASVALTFDDGPYPPALNPALEALERNALRATFFFTGVDAAKHPELARACTEHGHETGSHGYEHERCVFLSKEKLRTSLLRSRDQIQDATGLPCRWFRPPYGWWNPARDRVLVDCHQELVLWSVMTMDYHSSFTTEFLKDLLHRRLRERDIVVLHANERTTGRVGKAIDCVAAILKEKNLSSVTLADALPEAASA